MQLTIPKGATISTLDVPTLLQVIQAASLVISSPNRSDLMSFLQDPRRRDSLGLLIKLGQISDTCEFLDLCERNAYMGLSQKNDIRKILTGKIPIFLTPTRMNNIFVEKEVYSLYLKERKKLREDARKANPACIDLIPKEYRSEGALNAIQTHLINNSAKTWEKAINLYGKQLRELAARKQRWQTGTGSFSATNDPLNKALKEWADWCYMRDQGYIP